MPSFFFQILIEEMKRDPQVQRLYRNRFNFYSEFSCFKRSFQTEKLVILQNVEIQQKVQSLQVELTTLSEKQVSFDHFYIFLQ